MMGEVKDIAKMSGNVNLKKQLMFLGIPVKEFNWYGKIGSESPYVESFLGSPVDVKVGAVSEEYIAADDILSGRSPSATVAATKAIFCMAERLDKAIAGGENVFRLDDRV